MASLDNDVTNRSSTKKVSQNRRLMQGLVAVTGTASLKRTFLDLRDIRQANYRGPAETPHEGRIFWITIKITDQHPNQLPLMRFNTKIYHPNISPQGYVCYAGGQLHKYSNPLNGSDKWSLGSNRKLCWSIGALLTTLCGLLSSPDVDDPLVPEIAHTYLDDYDEYCCNARLYTKRYATDKRPDEPNFLFPDNASEEAEFIDSSHDLRKEEKSDGGLVSSQSSLGARYDDSYFTNYWKIITHTKVSLADPQLNMAIQQFIKTNWSQDSSVESLHLQDIDFVTKQTMGISKSHTYL
ncbi:hypothetical protein BPOR_1264g00010 [Botrytis porri]|uniref:UBC core domain-containing protein n=1 Tax=Botrytis porri TaxID=87229 RepID=A0A4Z1K6D8_9HELO|nr:hypothetical protein BPOR_1264g00010 [Botrytis porri]